MLAAFSTAPVFTAQAIYALEQQLRGVSEDSWWLIRKAGEALADHIQQQWPQESPVAIFCGPGNNGADGYYAAKVLHARGVEVQLVWVGGAGHHVSQHQYAQEQCTIPVIDAQVALRTARLIVDAILGNGARAQALPVAMVQVVQAINAAGLPILAVDLPTGVTDTGGVQEVAIKAHHTMAFIGYRLAHVTGVAVDYCGQVVLNSLGVDVAQAPSLATLLIRQTGALFSPRQLSAHKGTQGHVLVVGGDKGMGGAALLAGSAALHGGAGKVTVLTQEAHVASFLVRQPEIMVHGVTANTDISPWLAKADAVVLGPGLGRQPWGRALAQQALLAPCPLLCDADGLYWLDACNDLKRPHATVVTPHPGEAATLLNRKTAWVQTHRRQALESLMNKTQAVVVLKGNGTMVSREEAGPLVLGCGNPGMAVAGMGDVLSGVIGALLAQGMPAEHAATLGAWWHSYTADVLAQQQGEVALLPTKVIAALKETWSNARS